MDSDSNEVPDLQDPQSTVDDEVIEIIPDPRSLNPVKAEPMVQTNAAAELDAMCKSLLPKTLTEFPAASNLPVIGPSTKFHGPPNRRIPQTDWELFDHGGQTYLIIREERNRGFVRQYVSLNGRTFECCYCMEKSGKSVTATATKNAEGRYIVIAAVDHIHNADCSPIPYKFCVKFNQNDLSSSKSRSINMKVKKSAMKAAQMGSIQSILENLNIPKPTLEFQEKNEVINGNFPTTSISSLKPKVKIFSINPSSCRIVPDEDWEYGLGIRGEPKGVIIVKIKKDTVREFRLLKASQDGKMREYYCTACQHKYGRTIKVYIETSASGKETAKVLIAKPHAELCKGIPLNEAYEKQRAVEHRFAKQGTTSDSDVRTISAEGKVPVSRWRFALNADGVPNSELLIQVSGSTEIYREYRWVPEVSSVNTAVNEMVYKCKFCEEKNRNVPALLNISSEKISLTESPSSDHVDSCLGEPLETLMTNQFNFGKKNQLIQKNEKVKESLNNLQHLIQEVTEVNGRAKGNSISMPTVSGVMRSNVHDVNMPTVSGTMTSNSNYINTSIASNSSSSNMDYMNMPTVSNSSSSSLNYISTPMVSDLLTACLDLEVLPEEKYSLLNDDNGEKNRLWIVAEDDESYGFEFLFWKSAGIAGRIFLCKGCREAKKKTKAFVIDSEGGFTVQVDQNHHSRCSSKSFSDF